MAKSRIIGAKAHAARLRYLGSQAVALVVNRALFAAGEMIQVEAQLSITRGSVSGKGHVPSKPGEPPNQDTGVLANNIETANVRPLVVEVSSNALYAAALEFGTSKVAARPYMRPARDKKKKEAVQLVRNALDQAVKRSRSSNRS